MDGVRVFYLTRLSHHPSSAASSSAHHNLRTVEKSDEWSGRVVDMVDGVIYLRRTNCILDSLTLTRQQYSVSCGHRLIERRPLPYIFSPNRTVECFIYSAIIIIISDRLIALCLRTVCTRAHLTRTDNVCDVHIKRRSNIQIDDRKHRNRQNFSTHTEFLSRYFPVFIYFGWVERRLWAPEEHIIR